MRRRLVFLLFILCIYDRLKTSLGKQTSVDDEVEDRTEPCSTVCSIFSYVPAPPPFFFFLKQTTRLYAMSFSMLTVVNLALQSAAEANEIINGCASVSVWSRFC